MNQSGDITSVAFTTATDLLKDGRLEFGPSSWVMIDQARIDRFAQATLDDQWIHVDPARAAAGPFSRTIAHGYLVLSLVPYLLDEVLRVTDRAMGVNYGINRLRFTAPVPVGSAVRLSGRVVKTEARGDAVRTTLEVNMEVRDSDKPALVGEVIYLQYPGAVGD